MFTNGECHFFFGGVGKVQYCEGSWLWMFFTGMDKVREGGAPLPGNDKENWGNHHIDVTGVWKGVFILKFAAEEEIILYTPGFLFWKVSFWRVIIQKGGVICLFVCLFFFIFFFFPFISIFYPEGSLFLRYLSRRVILFCISE